MTEWMLIAAMAVLTFVPRYLPYNLAGKITIPALLSQALSYVPIAVLTVIVVQSALIRDGEVFLSLQNHHLLASVIAFFTALITRHMFLTIVLGLVSFVLMEWLLG